MFARLSSLLSTSLRRLGVEHEVTVRRILEEADRWLAHQISPPSSARCLRLQHGLLTVQVDHPATAQVIKMNQTALLALLRERFSRQAIAIEGLRFTTR